MPRCGSGPNLLRPLRLSIVDLGAVTLMFAIAGGIVVAASLIGFAGGVAGRMSYAPEGAPS